MQYFELNLTSISKNTYQCGTLAAQVVGNYLNGELNEIWPIHYELKPLLFKRNSTKV
jgi:DNA-binding LacI/PurR family transcriptional regulator